ncbi:hypothetical protein BMIN_0988 [Bifidobacterium minimum]|uniref:Uncharacterized protein n=1 Tax=Bifidobacterium minimum TaxID=1693 RepID=A0A087BRA3_9BIFI|nr:hypothetical protein BMIN_0988 [Bifidobacterium minimum]
MPGSRHGNAAAKAAIHRPAESVALISVALISCLQITATVGIRRGRIPAVVKRPTVVIKRPAVVERPAVVRRRPSTTRAINGTRHTRTSAKKEEARIRRPPPQAPIRWNLCTTSLLRR